MDFPNNRDQTPKNDDHDPNYPIAAGVPHIVGICASCAGYVFARDFGFDERSALGFVAIVVLPLALALALALAGAFARFWAFLVGPVVADAIARRRAYRRQRSEARARAAARHFVGVEGSSIGVGGAGESVRGRR